MRVLGMLWMRLRSLTGWQRLDRQLDDEMRFHFEKQIELNLARGMSPEEARRAARLEFGGVSQIQDDCRDERRVSLIRDFWQDASHALRGMRREPVLTLTVTLTLAICVGANTAMFSLVNSFLLRPLPYPDAGRIYWISENMGDRSDFITAVDYYTLRRSSPIFEEVAAFETPTVNWTGIENPEVLRAGRVTASFFKVMGTEPLLGRYFDPSEEGPAAPAITVLSHAFWSSRLGSDAGVIGRTLILNGVAVRVIGVMPPNFDYPSGVHLWTPQRINEAAQVRSPSTPTMMVNAVARVRAGISLSQVAGEMDRNTKSLYAEWKRSFDVLGFLQGFRLIAVPLQERITGTLRPALIALMGAVGLLLMIACANLANLLLARSSSRQKELAVRLALGSGRGRIARQLLTESVVMSLPGGLAAALIALGAIRSLNAWKPALLSGYPMVVFDLAALGFTFGVTLAASVLFGLIPAFGAARRDLHGVLRTASHQRGASSAATRVRQVLVVLELGLSLVLLIGAGLLTRSFVNLATTDLGFDSKNLLTFRVRLRGPRYQTGPQQMAYFDQAMEQIRQVPGVSGAAVTTDVSLSSEFAFQFMRYQVAGRPAVPVPQQPSANFSVVSLDYFRTLGVKVLNGRLFEPQDPSSGILINESLARIAFPGENPVGREITVGGGEQMSRWTILGVVASVRGGDLGADPPPVIYHCTCINPSNFLSSLVFVVRTSGDPHALRRAIEKRVYTVDATQPLFDVLTMEERMGASLASQRFQLTLIGIFGAIALTLAAVGVYGVMTYLVSQRSRELGIRLALGARPREVWHLVLRETLGLAAIATVAGLAGAVLLSRYVEKLLYHVKPLDPATLVSTAAVLIAIAVAASLWPALSASRIDPVVVLRDE